MKFRVVIKFGYHERYFVFDDQNEAVSFATTAVKHYVPEEDGKKIDLTIQIGENFDTED